MIKIIKQKKALLKAIKLVGGQSALARKCGVKQQSVNDWINNGIPPIRVLQIEKAVNFKITRHELAPELYPKDEINLSKK